MKVVLLTLAGAVLSAVIVAVGTIISAGLHADWDTNYADDDD